MTKPSAMKNYISLSIKTDKNIQTKIIAEI
jgi:hypothetical protein